MPKKITKDEFIKRSINKHGNKFNYDKVEYINQYTPVKIECPIHGFFEQIPKSHMAGYDCKSCSQLKVAASLKGVKKINKLDDKTIIDRLKSMYDYDYSKCKSNLYLRDKRLALFRVRDYVYSHIYTPLRLPISAT